MCVNCTAVEEHYKKMKKGKKLCLRCGTPIFGNNDMHGLCRIITETEQRRTNMEFNYPPWVPITDPKEIKILGKTMEEASELIHVVARCLIQGVDGFEPTTGRVNRQWMMEEVADVMLMLSCLIEEYDLDKDFIDKRIDFKLHNFKKWLEAI